MNQMHKIMEREPPELLVDDILAHPSRLGWIIGGSVPIDQGQVKGKVTATHIVCCAAALSSRQSSTGTAAAKALETLWSLEAVGITDPPSNSQLSADEEEALLQFNQGITYGNGRYAVSFPKKPSISQLPNNLIGARQRLAKKVSQLQLEPDRYQRYHTELMKFVDEGFAVEIQNLEPAEFSAVDGSYFMPHHEVVTSSSGKERSHPIALSADISRAYMRIAVNETDQPFFRFLWQAPGSSAIKTFQMVRVTWGAASSGFLLAATIRHHLEKGDAAVPELAKCLYADDLLQSFEDVERAQRFTDKVRQSLASAGMHLAKWKSNSTELKSHLLGTGIQPDDFDSSSAEFLKVLGIAWCPSEDVFSFKTPSLFDGPAPESPPSKRQVLSIVASIYDPLGWLTPFTLRGKKLIQRLWTQNLGWNDKIPEAIHVDLKRWMTEVVELRRFRIPRRYSCRNDVPVAHVLHLFGDASTTAYAAAAYIESKFADGSSDFALVMSKSRLAPRDSPSLPRLELLASLIAVRLKRFLMERLNIDFERTLFYTDSTIAYHWATSSSPGTWKQFVSNRVREIQSESRSEDWFHLSGESNIIDFATRGVSAATLVENSEWWFGPRWLRLPPISDPLRSHGVGPSA
ncbi:uncharacterized protein LOC100902581 [Galendromus occidentalis]|uniref:Uncharacterized protein LOC100902581 n=1 Tax=Galendromus occidentalis TaxID=34638 RepID=A0AAJ7WGN1_9ACAR|nr:uncharacterized protein LOC100902581 [Galendromus occidentalis]